MNWLAGAASSVSLLLVSSGSMKESTEKISTVLLARRSGRRVARRRRAGWRTREVEAPGEGPGLRRPELTPEGGSRRRPSRRLGSKRRRSGQEATELCEVVDTGSRTSMARGALLWSTCTLEKKEHTSSTGGPRRPDRGRPS
jgi:hypothetical protein